MKLTIPLEQAIQLLNESSAVIVDGDVVLYANAGNIGPEEPFLELTWDYEGNGYEAAFYPEDNKKVVFAGGSLWLVPRVDGAACPLESYQLTLLEPMNLERIVEDMDAIDKQDNHEA